MPTSRQWPPFRHSPSTLSPFIWAAAWQETLFTSQYLPVQPLRQSQVKVVPVWKQPAPFSQGASLHQSMSRSQLVPVRPCGQWHV